ncbi:hypothetical protein [Pseudomonas agarici]
MSIYGLVGSFEMVVDYAGSGCPPGYIEMQYTRPDGVDTLDYTAQPGGTWIITPETISAKLKSVEFYWQTEEMSLIENQLLAIEEGAVDAMPGTRQEWLQYRTKVRLWHESADFPDSTKRPNRPALV